MSMEMDTCRKSGIEEISNYAVRLQDKGDKEARENIDKLMIFYVSLGCCLDIENVPVMRSWQCLVRQERRRQLTRKPVKQKKLYYHLKSFTVEVHS